MIAKGELSNLTNNPSGAFSILLIIAFIAASVLTVTSLENRKTLVIAAVAFAAIGFYSFHHSLDIVVIVKFL